MSHTLSISLIILLWIVDNHINKLLKGSVENVGDCDHWRNSIRISYPKMPVIKLSPARLTENIKSY